MHPDGKPYWQIFDTCENLIRTLPSLIHDDNVVEDVSDKCEDHACRKLQIRLYVKTETVEGRCDGLTARHVVVCAGTQNERLLGGQNP